MTTAAALPRFVHLSILDIKPHPDNPRRIDDDHPSLEGLAQSIRETGLINPITVRDLKDTDDYQILAGERRWRAAKKAGLDKIMAQIVDVDDETAFHIITVENLQREDLHWLEEARGVEAMVKHGWDPATIGKHIGKSEQWVRLRAKLTQLSPAWRKEIERHDSVKHHWPVTMLELVARFPVAVQDAMLDDWEISDADTAAELQQAINEKFLHRLQAAAWSLDDAKLYPKAGACSACPKRSSCQQTLFADSAGDRCTDASCWAKKADLHLAKSLTEMKELHPGLKTLSDDYDVKADLRQHDVKECKEGAKGAFPVLIVAGARKGTLIHAQKLKAYDHSSNGGDRQVSKAKVSGTKLTIKERLDQLDKKRGKLVLASFVKWFKATKTPPPNLTPGELMKMAAAVGTHHRLGRYDAEHINKAIGTAVGSGAVKADAFDLLWGQVRQTMLDGFEWSLRAGVEAPMASISAVCLLDPAWATERNHWLEAAKKAVPMPKALEADLTAGKATKPAVKPKAKAAKA